MNLQEGLHAAIIVLLALVGGLAGLIKSDLRQINRRLSRLERRKSVDT